MNSDLQRAINAEKSFNNKNNLLITFHSFELSKNVFHSLQRNIKSVHILEPEFVAKDRCIIELKDSSETDAIKHAIFRAFNKKGFLTINNLDNLTSNYKNIDPFKLLVQNLPSFISERDIKQLYPLHLDFSYIESDFKNTKSIIVCFINARDALGAYKTTNQLIYRSNILQVQFYRNKCITEKYSEDCNSDSEDDISKWEKIENDCLKNKKVSDTLLVKNFPLDTTGIEILKLFPECSEYHFLPVSSSKSKSALIRFRRIEDAIKMYTISNNIFKTNILHIEFYYKSSDLEKLGKIQPDQKEKSIVNGIKDEYENEERRQNHSDLHSFENNLIEEEIISENVNPCVLQVENLPLHMKNEDFSQLFPSHEYFELNPKKSSDSCSAKVFFKNSSDALKDFKLTKNKVYQRRVLSVKFKSKKMKINPFALMKRKSNISQEDDTKRIKTKIKEEESDDVILVNEEPHLNPQLICEDDIECKSEEEEYTDDIYDNVNLDTEEFQDIEDNVSEENDFQGVELEDDSVLPLDEDDFS